MLIYLQMLDTPEEKSKFETLYYTHRRIMLHIAMQILKDHQLAEDAVQEAFILMQLCKKEGRMLIVVTHDISVADRCDRVIQMRNGKIAGYHTREGQF